MIHSFILVFLYFILLNYFTIEYNTHILLWCNTLPYHTILHILIYTVLNHTRCTSLQYSHVLALILQCTCFYYTLTILYIIIILMLCMLCCTKLTFLYLNIQYCTIHNICLVMTFIAAHVFAHKQESPLNPINASHFMHWAWCKCLLSLCLWLWHYENPFINDMPLKTCVLRRILGHWQRDQLISAPLSEAVFLWGWQSAMLSPSIWENGWTIV